jgi:hypothetical protein
MFSLSSLRPVLSSEDDTSQFDSNFTKQTPVDSPCGASLSESVNLVFQVGRISYLFVYLRTATVTAVSNDVLAKLPSFKVPEPNESCYRYSLCVAIF